MEQLRQFWKCSCSAATENQIGHVISKTGKDFISRASLLKDKMEYVLQSKVPTCPFYLYSDPLIQAMLSKIQEKSYGQIDLQKVPNRLYQSIIYFESMKSKIVSFYFKLEEKKAELAALAKADKKK